MGVTFKQGFTIIETMLFLAITGVMIATMLVGSSTSINVQRYKDSVNSVLSSIQGLYSGTADVQNDRPVSAGCGSTSQVTSTATASSPSVPVGQSDCVIMGKYAAFNSGTEVVSNVIGYSPATATTYSSAVAEFQAYSLSIDPTSSVTSTLEWNALVAPFEANSKSTKTTNIGILVVRAPSSGLIYTYTGDTPSSSNVSGLVSTSNQVQRRICIDSNGLYNGSQSVIINQNAVGSNDIRLGSNEDGGGYTC